MKKARLSLMMCKRSEQGFSFIEIMVAMLILSISLIVLMDRQARSMDLVGQAKFRDHATTLAMSKLNELTQEAEEKGVNTLKDRETGEFDQEAYPGYKWRYWKAKVPTPDFLGMLGAMGGDSEEATGGASNEALLAGPLQGITKVWGNALHELHVEVLWDEGKSQKSYALVTHLIASDAITQLQAAIGFTESQGPQGPSSSQQPSSGGTTN